MPVHAGAIFFSLEIYFYVHSKNGMYAYLMSILLFRYIILQ